MTHKEVLHNYSAFGLGIRSSLLLPELLSLAEVKEDIVIRTGRSAIPKEKGLESSYSISERKAVLTFSAVGTFLIEGGRYITVFPNEGVEDRLVRLPLLGAVLAVLLYQRGSFVLHASAVSLDGVAVIFMGNKGDGKSTTASILCSRGWSLLSDDTVVFDLSDISQVKVFSGFPQLKLYPDSVSATSSDDPEQLPEIASNTGKRARSPESFFSGALPLRAIYALGTSAEIGIRQMSTHEALPFLLANSYMARFNNNWLEAGIATGNLRHCSKVLNDTPIYLLQRPRNLATIEEVASAIENHLQTDS